MEIKNIQIKSEKQQLEELKKEEATRDTKKYGLDGNIEIGRKTFEYKGIKYDVAILRYFTLKPIKIGRIRDDRRISDFHAVVEYPKETEKLVALIEKMDEYSEFMWYDTLHSWNDKQTIEEQIEECHKHAKADINSIPDRISGCEKKIKNLEKNIKKIKSFLGDC